MTINNNNNKRDKFFWEKSINCPEKDMKNALNYQYSTFLSICMTNGCPEKDMKNALKYQYIIP